MCTVITKSATVAINNIDTRNDTHEKLLIISPLFFY